MKTRLLVAVAAGLMVGAADPAPDLGEVQSQEIPPGSKWVCLRPDGGFYPDEFGSAGIWRALFNPPRGVWVWQYLPGKSTLNPSASPPRIDAQWGQRRRHGIYRLVGDRLWICLSWESASRPTSFVHKPNDDPDQCLFILKRLK